MMYEKQKKKVQTKSIEYVCIMNGDESFDPIISNHYLYQPTYDYNLYDLYKIINNSSYF